MFFGWRETKSSGYARFLMSKKDWELVETMTSYYQTFVAPGGNKMNEWTKIQDGLPDHMDDVLVTIQINRREPKVRSGCYIQLEDRGLFALDNGDTWNSTDKEIVAWMYSPAPCRRQIE